MYTPTVTRDQQPFVPDVFSNEPIEAWRAWLGHYNEESGWILKSVTFHRFVWPAVEAAEGTCPDSVYSFNRGCKEPPGATHFCGIHALKLFRYVKEQSWGGRCPQRSAGVCVYGRVYLWGRVVEGKDGYRSQYAYPSELWIPDWTDQSKIYFRNPNYLYGFEQEELRRGLSKTYSVPTMLGEPRIER